MDEEYLKKRLLLHEKWVNEHSKRRDFGIYNVNSPCGEKGVRLELIGHDLNGVDLSWKTLAGADLSWANLTNAKLVGASLEGALLPRSTLTGADLSRAGLTGANLVEAKLNKAILKKADLSEVNFTRADLRGADLREAIYAVSTILRAYWYLPKIYSPFTRELIRELMAHDAESCGIEAMDKWANGKDYALTSAQFPCPFSVSERDFYFIESRLLWNSLKDKDKVPKLRGRALLEALCESSGILL